LVARCVFIAAALVALGAGPAHAWTLALSIDGPTACADEPGFRRMAELQRTAPGQDVDAAVAVAARTDGSTWAVGLRIFLGVAAPASRTLAAATCDEALAAAALIVALALDGAPAVAALPELAVFEPPPPPVERVTPTPRRSASARGALVTHLRGALAVGGSLEPGRIGGALDGDVALQYWRLAFALGVGGLLPRATGDADGGGLRSSAWMTHAGLRAEVGRGVDVGIAVEIGKLRATSTGVQSPRTESLQWQALSLTSRVPLWPARPGSPFLGFDLNLPLAQYDLLVNGTTRYQTGISGRLWIGWQAELF
jgi:hypothetical protein